MQKAHEVSTKISGERVIKLEVRYRGDRIDTTEALLELADYIVTRLDEINAAIKVTASDPLPQVVDVHFTRSTTTTQATNMWSQGAF